MRKRVVAEAETLPHVTLPHVPQPAPAVSVPPPRGQLPVHKFFCGECGLPQRDPLGVGSFCCSNSHVDAPTVTREEGEQIQARLLGQTEEQWQANKVKATETVDEKVAKVERTVGQLSGRPETSAETVGVLRQAVGEVSDVVAAVSAELRKTLDEAEKAYDPREATTWDNANKAEEVELDPAFMSIVKTLVVDDPLGAYKWLEAELVVGENRADYGSVMKHLDHAEVNARKAHRLWQSAILERKRWELDNAVVFAAMETEALRTLQHEKDQKSRAKMITDADVQTRVAILFPDEYRAQEIRRLKAKSMVDSMQNLADLWLSRCKTLQVILSKQR